MAEPRRCRGSGAGKRRRPAECREEPDLQSRRSRACGDPSHRRERPSALSGRGNPVRGRTPRRSSAQDRLEPKGPCPSRLEAARRFRGGRQPLRQVGGGERHVRAAPEKCHRRATGWGADGEPPQIGAIGALVRMSVWSALLLAPVVVSCVYWIATAAMMRRFFREPRPGESSWLPAVSLIKPVCGLEKNLYRNLSTACRQEYPDYEVIFSVQDSSDPALPLLARIRDENPCVPVRIIVDGASAGPNGRLSNILNATSHASGHVLVYSDSDMRLEPGYLRAIVAPLADPRVGIACTLYRAEGADNPFEALELLSLNTDFLPSMVFAMETGAALACPGASQALRRETLTLIGGLEPMAYRLVEDLELGRAVVGAGLRIALLPHVAVTGVDLPRASAWWRHQVYWDQNTRVANPV